MAGVPILATPLKEIQPVIWEWDIGDFLSAPMDAESVARDILNFPVAGSERYSQMKSNCYRFAKADCWDFYEKRLTEAYRKKFGGPSA